MRLLLLQLECGRGLRRVRLCGGRGGGSGSVSISNISSIRWCRYVTRAVSHMRQKAGIDAACIRMDQKHEQIVNFKKKKSEKHFIHLIK